MKRYSRQIGIFGLLTLLSAGAGCVDSKSSLHIRSVVAYEGTSETEAITCTYEARVKSGGGGQQEETITREVDVGKPTLTCDLGAEAGDVENIRGSGTVDIADFDPNGGPAAGLGQLAPNTLSDPDVCGLTTVVEENNPNTVKDDELVVRNDADRRLRAQFSHFPWTMPLEITNRLQDSRNVGSESQGGGQGGYEGLELNANDIHYDRLKVTFPNAPADEIEKTIRMEGLAESGGGGVVGGVDLWGAPDVPDLKKVHKRIVREQTGGSYRKLAEITLVAEFQAKGRTIGGRDVESNKFRWPITFCIGGWGKGCGTTPICTFEQGG